MTFSSTVMLSKLRTTWNVRATPAREQATGPAPLIRRPSEPDLAGIGADLAGDAS